MTFLQTQFKTEKAFIDFVPETIGVNFKIIGEIEQAKGRKDLVNIPVGFSFVSDSQQKLNELSGQLYQKYNAQSDSYSILENGIYYMSWRVTIKELTIDIVNHWVFDLLLL